MAAIATSGVKTEIDSYSKYAAKWKRSRDVCDGQDAIHDAGTLYLPRLKDQSNEDYGAYVLRTPFVNYSWRTVAALLGLLFRKPPTVKNPPGVDALLDDVTLTGTPLDVFVQEVAQESFIVGRVGILVDFPTAPETNPDGPPVTVADAANKGLRPTMQIIRLRT